DTQTPTTKPTTTPEHSTAGTTTTGANEPSTNLQGADLKPCRDSVRSGDQADPEDGVFLRLPSASPRRETVKPRFGGKTMTTMKIGERAKSKSIWRGLQAISGQGKNGKRRNPEPGDRDWANKLNLFFNRFDTGPTSTPLSLSTDQPTSSSLCLHAPSPPSTPPPSLGLSPSPPPSPPSLQCSSPPPPPSPNLFTPTVDQVRTQLKKIKARKATGPDWHQLQTPPGLCRPALSGGLLHLQPEPESGKSSCPVEDVLVWFQSLKLRVPKEPNHFRPVALTSHLMKALERIVLRHLRLPWHQVPPTGNSPLTFPLHFTLYTSDFTYSTDSCHLQKFSDDDTAIVGCVSEGNDCEYRKVIMDFVDWCELNHPSSQCQQDKGDVVCWGGGCSERDKKRLNRLIKRASSVCGSPLDSIEVMGERRALAKLSTIMDNTSHPLHQTVGALSSSFSNRLRHPRCRKELP
ncbi:hypothetical protein L3Q82_011346, partial [Scortum barcoo]